MFICIPCFNIAHLGYIPCPIVAYSKRNEKLDSYTGWPRINGTVDSRYSRFSGLCSNQQLISLEKFTKHIGVASQSMLGAQFTPFISIARGGIKFDWAPIMPFPGLLSSTFGNYLTVHVSRQACHFVPISRVSEAPMTILNEIAVYPKNDKIVDKLPRYAR